jgi:hypothetical protein
MYLPITNIINIYIITAMHKNKDCPLPLHHDLLMFTYNMA